MHIIQFKQVYSVNYLYSFMNKKSWEKERLLIVFKCAKRWACEELETKQHKALLHMQGAEWCAWSNMELQHELAL